MIKDMIDNFFEDLEQMQANDEGWNRQRELEEQQWADEREKQLHLQKRLNNV